jgi:hypothetical protein
LPIMPGNTSNLSVDEQQVIVTTAKWKEDDATAAAQAAAIAAARKTLDEARVREHTAALTWEKEKAITHHLE